MIKMNKIKLWLTDVMDASGESGSGSGENEDPWENGTAKSDINIRFGNVQNSNTVEKNKAEEANTVQKQQQQQQQQKEAFTQENHLNAVQEEKVQHDMTDMEEEGSGSGENGKMEDEESGSGENDDDDDDDDDLRGKVVENMVKTFAKAANWKNDTKDDNETDEESGEEDEEGKVNESGKQDYLKTVTRSVDDSDEKYSSTGNKHLLENAVDSYHENEVCVCSSS